MERYISDGSSSVVLPTGCVVVGDGAFRACADVREVVVPEGVTRIGRYAFASCLNLEGIKITRIS